MINIKGYDIDQLPVKDLTKVSDLIYFDGPYLSLYKNDKSDYYLFYWVDSDSYHNRWLLFRVSSEEIQSYLNRHLSLLDIVTNPLDGFLYKIDISDKVLYENIQITLPSFLPTEYKPTKDSYYDFEQIPSDIDLSQYSTKYKAGVFQAYFKNSSKIPFNQIDLEIFGPAMNDLYELNNGLGKSYLKKRTESAPRDNNNRPIIDINRVKINTGLMYVGQVGGSFSALFKSKSNTIPLDGFQSEVDDYMDYFMGFVSSSENIEDLKTFVESLDKKIVSSYKSLLQTIIKSKLKFYLRYENTQTNFQRKKDLNYTTASRILSILEKLEYNESTEIKMVGKFTALNLKTGSYEFDQTEDGEETSKGKFDKGRLQAAYQISFQKYYSIIIERHESKQAGNKKPKINDSIVSFIEITAEDKNEAF